jgi:flagellar L-ring protein precursor FlgH
MIVAMVLPAALVCDCLGQSSSLYVEAARERVLPQTVSRRQNVVDRLAPALAASSFTAVALPEPRVYTVHDLITIVVRESTENDTKSSLETEKDAKINGGIDAFPKFQLADILNGQLGASNMSRGKPKVEIDFKKEFTGDGTFKRKDTFTTRLTAKIIDIKPNGLLVLEARKNVQTDKETVSVILTGTCRTEDVGADNSVLSTNLSDLRILKQHEGEVKDATKKGIVTQILEGVFAF